MPQTRKLAIGKKQDARDPRSFRDRRSGKRKDCNHFRSLRSNPSCHVLTNIRQHFAWQGDVPHLRKAALTIKIVVPIIWFLVHLDKHHGICPRTNIPTFFLNCFCA
uniref:Uncharacterized protein n=1 Tax=Alexandrium catenella TaxID=2925 RepID=A0A7S1S6H7_ALECA